MPLRQHSTLSHNSVAYPKLCRNNSNKIHPKYLEAEKIHRNFATSKVEVSFLFHIA